jgi:hypothetical protein
MTFLCPTTASTFVAAAVLTDSTQDVPRSAYCKPHHPDGNNSAMPFSASSDCHVHKQRHTCWCHQVGACPALPDSTRSSHATVLLTSMCEAKQLHNDRECDAAAKGKPQKRAYQPQPGQSTMRPGATNGSAVHIPGHGDRNNNAARNLPM